MLAGRKLLLADDSITIQKVVDLTFADEGVTVVSFLNGRDAIDQLEQLNPDIVLADVFMPQVNGYELCEHIKQNEKLAHIPVMLLVGSFEPFDEAEARRVGADDTLTKPFQSIRRLIDKVSNLVSGRTEAGEGPTADLSKEEPSAKPVMLSNQEIERSTADTRPLPQVMAHAEKSAQAHKDMEQETTATTSNEPEFVETSGDLLLDIGTYAPASVRSDEEFILDVDLDEMPEPSPAEPAYVAPVSLNRDRIRTTLSFEKPLVDSRAQVATVDQMAATQEFARPVLDEPKPESKRQAVGDLSPEMLDAIARRVVEHMSEKVVREIAWEVVPDLAELMIKRQLEEKNM